LAILWENDAPNRVVLPKSETVQEHDVLQETASQLQAYFAGTRTAFDVPTRLNGTDFQQQVWHALQTIPYGQTRTYKDIATALGRPTASRAVGAAIGKNPLSIVIPCHRVLGVTGRLTGFAGGLDSKRFLLDLEQAPTSSV
jgi:methylated-DNA-[protein]-cysteine S-methyltransferase